MSNELTVVEQKQVAFYSDQVTAVLVEQADGERVVYVPIRPICDLLGVAWSPQRRRINRDAVLSETCVTVTVTQVGDTQRRQVLALPLDYLNGWLFGINADRVKSEARDQLVRYQKDCYRVLSDAFKEGKLSFDNRYANLLNNTDSPAAAAYRMAQAILDMAKQQVIMESQLQDHEQRLLSIEEWRGDVGRMITPAQASELSQAVRAVALVFSKTTGRNEYGGVYGELYRQYSISSYKQLPASKFDEAMNWLRQWYEDLADGDAVVF